MYRSTWPRVWTIGLILAASSFAFLEHYGWSRRKTDDTLSENARHRLGHAGRVQALPSSPWPPKPNFLHHRGGVRFGGEDPG
jgi:hypothetical protein